jgi:hypothetical protein
MGVCSNAVPWRILNTGLMLVCAIAFDGKARGHLVIGSHDQ